MIIIRIGNKKIRFGNSKKRKSSPDEARTDAHTKVGEDYTKPIRHSSKKRVKKSGRSISSFTYSDMLKFSTRIISILTIFCLVAGFIIRILPTSSRTPKVIANAKRQKGVIFINPAGGGNDSGATYADRKAKEDNLELALIIKDSLEKKNYKVIISRTSDKTVKVSDRVTKANKSEANFMVTIDRDKASKDESTGINAYVNTNKDLKAQCLAASIINEVNALDANKASGILHIGKKGNSDENYTVNSKAKMPSCVLLIGSVASKTDNELIDKNKKEYAEAIANGIESAYYKVYNSGEEITQETVNVLAENDFIEKENSTDDSEENSNDQTKLNESSDSSGSEEKKKKENPDKYDDSEDSYGDLM